MPIGSKLIEIDPLNGRGMASVALPEAGRETFAAGTLICVRVVKTFCVDTRRRRLVHQYVQSLQAAGDGSYWGVDDGSVSLLRVDPRTGRTTGTVRIEQAVSWSPQIAVCAHAVWVSTGGDHSLRMIDPTTLRIEHVTRLPDFDSMLADGCGYGKVWVQQNANGAGRLFAIDSSNATITASIKLGDPSLARTLGGVNLAFADGSVWTADSSPTVTRVDTHTMRVRGVHREPLAEPEWVTIAGGAAWISDDNGTAVRIPVS